jgi:peptidoglycan DL-endopeptidase CwlO
VVAVFAALTSGGAASPPSEQAAELRAENAALAARSSSALLELYALEQEQAAAQARVASIRGELDELEERRRRVQVRLAVARYSLRVAERHLADRLRALYQRGQTDPVAVLLGSESLDEAMTSLESLRSVAAHDRQTVAQVRGARRGLAAAYRALAARTAELRAARAAAERTAAALAGARAEREAYLARLASQRGLNSRQIARLDAAAGAAQARSEQFAASVPAASVQTQVPRSAPATAVPVAGPRTLTVVATGYSLPGRTATGIPVAWGVVAVDPSVIPLGTKMTIPGYGVGIAADTGPGVYGTSIDLWFPSIAQALAWGKRLVTVTLH